MRIAYICADPGVPVHGSTGSSTHVREMVRALVSRGLGVTLLAACLADHRRSEAPWPSVELTADPLIAELRSRLVGQLRTAGRGTSRASELQALLLNEVVLRELTERRQEIDVVYERQSLWSLAGLQFARRENLPFILELNAPLAAQQQKYRELDLVETAETIERLLVSHADRIIVTSPALREYARARGAHDKRIREIPCGAPSSFLDARRERHDEDDGFVLGFLGSLKSWHGIDILLEAFRQLTRLDPAYRLLIVGAGPSRDLIDGFARQHHLSERIRLVGPVDHSSVPQYLSRMDVGLAPYPPLPSFYFSPLKLWEYAAAGVPIVASAVGDLPVLLPHRSAALLHPAGSIGKIVKHVEGLRTSPALRRRLARRARQIARRHTWDRLAARLEAIARRAACEHRPRRG